MSSLTDFEWAGEDDLDFVIPVNPAEFIKAATAQAGELRRAIEAECTGLDEGKVAIEARRQRVMEGDFHFFRKTYFPHWTTIDADSRLHLYAGAASADAIAFAGQELRLASIDLPEVVATHRSAERLRIDTALDGLDDAANLAMVLAALEGRDWLALSATVLTDHPALRCGATLWLSHNEMPLDLPAIITGIEVEADRTTIEARAWL